MQVENTDILLKDVRNNFDKIYVLYYSRMFRFAKEYVLFDEDAENIVQDVFLLLWEKREVLDIQISLVSYLFALVKNKSLDYLRHKVIADEYKQELSAKLTALELLNYSFTSDEEIEQILMTAINKLPERCRQVFLKSRIEGKRNREIANELNLTVSTVENQMTIALRKLRVELKDYLPLLLFLLDVK
ncbi:MULTISPECIES: RNA polymerase sigma-70 factor [Parabacteroides]|jgi:RNA polymerase sigma-70 factor (family 1)|uniref:RNA polymerase sigma-70 factor n=1 Tax=Parabacteroides segnis TaxID=2763058 RepID=A0ABR7E9G3_9BACT|nr:MULTISPECIES: RNA polymerase sigma-70 factor [Parabacteroides]MBC5645793.1 RNA polymerase sigma-70 factor [Parabacteroides segnis]MCM0715551.1 RNA polymerase sigma-70 factor [Parabacteroides sp. TA-V-105]MCM0720124.1 RNA polymerase sigma-70 factor [Parabacteroides sp. W1-Q-101]RGY97215.1 RNA polymerase sigma-70 factor [Parabacteroides sp. AM58-2XD]GKG75544.1 RNA polymerase sigma-70 factor [Parabacteroides goldsteinii]